MATDKDFDDWWYVNCWLVFTSTTKNTASTSYAAGKGKGLEKLAQKRAKMENGLDAFVSTYTYDGTGVDANPTMTEAELLKLAMQDYIKTIFEG